MLTYCKEKSDKLTQRSLNHSHAAAWSSSLTSTRPNQECERPKAQSGGPASSSKSPGGEFSKGKPYFLSEALNQAWPRKRAARRREARCDGLAINTGPASAAPAVGAFNAAARKWAGIITLGKASIAALNKGGSAERKRMPPSFGCQRSAIQLDAFPVLKACRRSGLTAA
ncbi:hypothetical protein MRX96_041571 [Rhipicephalus microplus]